MIFQMNRRSNDIKQAALRNPPGSGPHPVTVRKIRQNSGEVRRIRAILLCNHLQRFIWSQAVPGKQRTQEGLKNNIMTDIKKQHLFPSAVRKFKRFLSNI